ncbi:MAG TPA: hypothetical protein DCM02_08550 [Flavobacterium sp.]|nr:hypothetical protein [Flavobacterium sp.]
MITQKTKHQTAFYYERLVEIEAEAKTFIKPKYLNFNVYALADLLDWNGNIVCKYGDKVSLQVMKLDNGNWSATIKGDYNTFFFTKGTKEEIAKLVGKKPQELPLGYYIGDIFYY